MFRVCNINLYSYPSHNDGVYGATSWREFHHGNCGSSKSFEPVDQCRFYNIQIYCICHVFVSIFGHQVRTSKDMWLPIWACPSQTTLLMCCWVLQSLFGFCYWLFSSTRCPLQCVNSHDKRHSLRATLCGDELGTTRSSRSPGMYRQLGRKRHCRDPVLHLPDWIWIVGKLPLYTAMLFVSILESFKICGP